MRNLYRNFLFSVCIAAFLQASQSSAQSRVNPVKTQESQFKADSEIPQEQKFKSLEELTAESEPARSLNNCEGGKSCKSNPFQPEVFSANNESNSSRNLISNHIIMRNVDMVYAGYGGMRNVGTGTLTLSGLSGTVLKAILYWHGPTNTTDPTANATVNFNGNNITGMNIGFASDNCWQFLNSQAYRADVTAHVTGNGSYSLNNFMKNGIDININGVSLIVFFDDGNPSNNRDFVILDGNDSNIATVYDPEGWNVLVQGINYSGGNANAVFHVADGQEWYDDHVYLNAVILGAGPDLFNGVSVPYGSGYYNGSLWDIRSFDFSSFLSPGINDLSFTTGVYEDCLSLVVLVLDLPVGAAPTVFESAKINGTKFSDLNQNGVRDTGEPPLANWEIELYDEFNNLLQTAITNPAGVYEFVNLPAGTYIVSEVQKTGWVQTMPASPGTYTLLLSEGEEISGLDFGNHLLPGFICGMKYHDLNFNGIKDPGEPGIENWTIILYSYTSFTYQYAITNADGSYCFENLSSEWYAVYEESRPGWLQISTPQIYSLDIQGNSFMDVDFGNAMATISGVKFFDINQNGIKDTNEPGLSNWVINLTGSVNQYTLTDNNGYYAFYNLPAGTYVISEELVSGWTQTMPPAPGTYTLNVVDENSQFFNVDFGNFSFGSICGTKYHDLNNNGLRDQGEPGIENWAITLFSANTSESLIAYTDSDGYYCFEDLTPGLYDVSEESRPGWKQSSSPSVYQIYIEGNPVENINFGNIKETISGQKFYDENQNGVKDPGEPGLPAWIITITGTVNDLAFTDSEGNYAFYGLPPGTYTVSEQLVNEWTQTMPPAPGTYTINVIDENSHFTDIDFGNYTLLGSICGMKYHDLNKNGNKDPGEPGIEGWTIILYGNDNYQETLTDESGNYCFDNLSQGYYEVSEEYKFPWYQTSDPYYYYLTVPGNHVDIDFGNATDEYDFGDAPDGSLAYPASGVIGMFPTCALSTGYIQHNNYGSWFGPSFDGEFDGNANFCPGFNPDYYNMDECFNDGDAGLLFPGAFTIAGPVGEEEIVTCPNADDSALGNTCSWAAWGSDIDIYVANNNAWESSVYVNVIIDWNQDGYWGGSSQCGQDDVPEHVLVDFEVPFGFSGSLSQLNPPDFLIGTNAGFVWARFSITDYAVSWYYNDWDGSGYFYDGETEDYLLKVASSSTLNLQNWILGDGSQNCFEAPETIILAGSETIFHVESGAEVDFAAGINILMLPGTWFREGSDVWAFIDPSGNYCAVNRSIVSAEALPELQSPDQEASESLFRIFPNPTTGFVNVEFAGNNPDDKFLIEIFSAIGERIIRREISGIGSYNIDLSDRSNGLYFIRLSNGTSTTILKIIKQ